MAMIDINLDETPDKMEPVKAGIRVLDIKDIETQDTPNGAVHVVTLAVNQPDTEDHERLTWDRFNFKYTPARIKFKQLCKAAGHSGVGGGVEPSELIGCTVKAAIKDRTYQDKDTGETVATTQISKYLFEPDE